MRALTDSLSIDAKLDVPQMPASRKQTPGKAERVGNVALSRTAHYRVDVQLGACTHVLWKVYPMCGMRVCSSQEVRGRTVEDACVLRVALLALTPTP